MIEAFVLSPMICRSYGDVSLIGLQFFSFPAYFVETVSEVQALVVAPEFLRIYSI